MTIAFANNHDTKICQTRGLPFLLSSNSCLDSSKTKKRIASLMPSLRWCDTNTPLVSHQGMLGITPTRSTLWGSPSGLTYLCSSEQRIHKFGSRSTKG